jgi:uroporphyrinogen-III decarboxylase
MGNVSTTLTAMKSAEDVYEATMDVIRKSGKGGRLFVSGGCILPDICPAENIRAMVKATRAVRI